MKDYYKILGLSPDCSQEDIKKAYRKLARDSHPDCCGKEDSSDFREIQEAYEAIGEKSNRDQYDRQRRAQQQRSQNWAMHPFHIRATGSHYPCSFENYFDQILNRVLNNDPFHLFSDGFHNQLEVILSQEEARNGGIIPVEIPIRHTCPVCQGRGSNLIFFCPHCFGSGSIVKQSIVNIEIPPNVVNASQYHLSVPGYGVLSLIIIIR